MTNDFVYKTVCNPARHTYASYSCTSKHKTTVLHPTQQVIAYHFRDKDIPERKTRGDLGFPNSKRLRCNKYRKLLSRMMVEVMHWEVTSGSWWWRKAGCKYGSLLKSESDQSRSQLPGRVVDASSVDSFQKRLIVKKRQFVSRRLDCTTGLQMWNFKLRFYQWSYKLQVTSYTVLVIDRQNWNESKNMSKNK